MEYRVYTTPALVLGGTAKGEANKRLLLLTRDLGVIAADAQRIRDISSKLRYALQQFSLAQVSVVYGRGGWRVTNAAPLLSYWRRLRIAPVEARQVAARLCFLVRHLVAGEESNPAIFYIVSEALNTLVSSGITAEHAKTIEHIAVLRLLCELGYVERRNKDISPLLMSASYSRELCRFCWQYRHTVVHQINHSLKVSQLV